MDKTFLVAQLSAKLKTLSTHAQAFAAEIRDEAKSSGANRAINLAKATTNRSAAAIEATFALESFRAKPFKRTDPISLGAVVEIEDGTAGKTLFLAPAGAGEELTGPDGDGFFHVVTPRAPLGKALLGKRVGDVIETMVKGELTEWTITFVA